MVINIPDNLTEIYAVSVQTGRYDWENSDRVAYEFDDHAGYPKYYTDYNEAKEAYNSIVLNTTDEYPQRKSITTISLLEGDTFEEEENY